jgi:hypothetical protein
MGRPPRRWTWRWSTLWPPSWPTFVTSRQPPPRPSRRARSPVTSKRCPRRGPSASVRSAAEAMWAFGSTRRCVGACGLMSRIAITRSSSWSLVEGISPATMRQNRQSSGMGAAYPASRPARSRSPFPLPVPAPRSRSWIAGRSKRRPMGLVGTPGVPGRGGWARMERLSFQTSSAGAGWDAGRSAGDEQTR